MSVIDGLRNTYCALSPSPFAMRLRMRTRPHARSNFPLKTRRQMAGRRGPPAPLRIQPRSLRTVIARVHHHATGKLALYIEIPDLHVSER